MSELADNRDNFCYRHPDRQSFILCQRCGRTVCPQCATQAAVGVHCPECVKEGRANAPRRAPVNIRAARRLRSVRGGPIVTYTILGLMAAGYVIGLLGPSALFSVAYAPELTLVRPWTMLTYPFSNVSILSLLLNGLIMFFLGRQAEESLGRARFIALLLISTFAGAVAMLMFVPMGALFGSSPAIWGLFGVILIYARAQGSNVTGLLVMLVLFVVIGLVVGTTWQASVGGLVGGATVTTIYLRLGSVRQAREQKLAIAGLVAALVALAVIALVIR